VGGGYASDALAQLPLSWIMMKAQQAGLTFRSGFSPEPVNPSSPITDSYAAFTPRPLRLISRPYDRVVGADPNVDANSTTSRINETIDASVFERWRTNPTYRPPSLIDWSSRKKVDPARIVRSVQADDPTVSVT